MAAPAQSYSIIFSAYMSPLGATVPAGYVATKSADGLSYVVASTANLAASHSGTPDGVLLSQGNPGDTVQIQRDAKVDPGVCPWLGTGPVEAAVIDANGKIQRASVYPSGIQYGVVDKEGGVSIGSAGGALPVLSLAGDVNGPTAANQVWSISGNAGAVSILGGAWSIAAAIALSVTHLAQPTDALAQDMSFETQSANAAASLYTLGGNFQFTLGSNKDALVVPWDNPSVPALLVNYRDRATGVQNIAGIEPTRFFGAAGIGAGMYLAGANSWLQIGAVPTVNLGVISVDPGTDAIATRNHANTLDMAVFGTDTSDHVVLARLNTAGVVGAPLAGVGSRMVTADATGLLGTAALPTSPSVTGSGVWHSTSGVLDVAASRGSANQVFVTNGAATDTAWATTGGDVTGAITNLVVGRLQGSVVISGTPSNGQALVATSSTAASWATVSSVTWAQDLAGSTNTNQIVIALTGTSGVTMVRTTSSVNAIAFGSSGTASTGDERFKNGASSFVRNSAGTGNHGVWLSATDALFYGSDDAFGTSTTTQTNVCSNASFNVVVAGTTRFTASTTFLTAALPLAMGSNSVQFGATPSASGDQRHTNNTTLITCKSSVSGDIICVRVDSTNSLCLGCDEFGTTSAAKALLGGTNNVFLITGGGVMVAVTTALTYVVSTNFSIGATAPTMNSATNTIFIANGTAPSAAPSSGGYLYVESGFLKYRGPTTGSITTLAAA